MAPTANEYSKQWDQVSQNLREIRDEEESFWKSVDKFLLARYLAHTCSEAEYYQVEQLKEQSPQIREIIMLLSEIRLERKQ